MPPRLPHVVRPRRLLIAVAEEGRRLYRAWLRRGIRLDGIGAVEGAWAGDDLTGWVRGDVWADGATPVVGVYRENERVGLTVAIEPAEGERPRFAVHVAGGHVMRDLASGALTVHLLRDGRPVARIPLTEDLAEAVRARAAIDYLDHLGTLSDEAQAATRERLRVLLGEAAADHSGLAAAGTLRGARSAFQCAMMEPVRDPARALTPLRVPVGLRSADGVAMLGHDGQLFIVGGRNRALEEYIRADDDPRPVVLAEDWLALMERRRDRLEAAGARYVQLILPETMTLAPELFPLPIRTPGAILRGIEAGLARSTRPAACYVSARHALAAVPDPGATVLRTDSHLSSYGTCAVFRAVLAHLGLPAGPEPVYDILRAGTGDLASRFFGVPFLDLRRELDPRPYDEVFGHAELTFQRTAPGGHVGFAQSWRNPVAPIDASVLVLGNSYCGPADEYQARLSWWFARWFRTYHFAWKARLPDGLVQRLRPDIVVCQTVERFLVDVPDS
ncbi:hypothetical protein [Methylobacterium radiodurans]|uniref:AlgX/AlgJ SGNH hydrolase-like domain-containing protein n=1 Tax=Methylobacterium radiodurans TaxID=2202828 RepID=A0A2U8VRA8_9HYPH|nr:hypothetical protein [Methylobacterium radiodurans]AWN36223.1 hypothetical protein DK427_11255 [Methylobacterium radiodurans]